MIDKMYSNQKNFSPMGKLKKGLLKKLSKKVKLSTRTIGYYVCENNLIKRKYTIRGMKTAKPRY